MIALGITALSDLLVADSRTTALEVTIQHGILDSSTRAAGMSE